MDNLEKVMRALADAKVRWTAGINTTEESVEFYMKLPSTKYQAEAVLKALGKDI